MLAKYRKWVCGQSVVRGILAFSPFNVTYQVSFYLGERISINHTYKNNTGLKNTSVFARFF
jgi:hypothetical protein